MNTATLTTPETTPATATPPTRTPVATAILPATRFVAIDGDGCAAEPGTAAHAWTRDTWLGVDWPLFDASNAEVNQDETDTIVERNPGMRVPTAEEMFAIINPAFRDPACDPVLFPAFSSDSWYRTSSPAPWAPESYVRVVGFSYGLVSSGRRVDRYWLRLVRPVSPSPGQ